MRGPFPMGLVALLVAASAAGCLDGTQSGGPVGSRGAASTSSAAAPSAAPTAETGSIQVMVTTNELEPIEGAVVELVQHNQSAFTDASGAAVFNQLEPGQYSVLAAKAGYRAVEEHGRLVEVLAGEVVDVRLRLDPIETVSAENPYHRTFPFQGFISCSVDGAAGYSSVCRGRDPNDSTCHAWTVENTQVQGLVTEAQWNPTLAPLGSQLHMRTYHALQAQTACPTSAYFMLASGASPLRNFTVEGENGNVSKVLGSETEKQRKHLYLEIRSHCPRDAGCVVAVMLQQRYDAFATAFYGKEPPPDFTALPK